MSDNTMLDRLANTLKRDIAPAIDDEFLKTQAYMSSVVVLKLARQLALESEHRSAGEADIAALLVDLRERLAGEEPIPAVTDALDTLDAERDRGALSNFIEALYAAREPLGESRFGDLLARVRQTLRADIDRRMVYAK